MIHGFLGQNIPAFTAHAHSLGGGGSYSAAADIAASISDSNQ